MKKLKIYFSSVVVCFLMPIMISCTKTIPIGEMCKSTRKITVSKQMDEYVLAENDVLYTTLLEFISKHDEDWSNPGIGTYPSSQYTVAFISEDGLLFPLWVGNDFQWIGTRYNDRKYIKNLSETDRKVLEKIMLEATSGE